MGFSLGSVGKIVGGLIGGPTGAVIGAAAGSLFDSGGGGAAGGGSSGRSSAVQGFLDRSGTAAREGQEKLKNIKYENITAAEKAAAILNGYLQEKPREQRQDTQERLRNFSLYR
jgi:hypothetical protein